MAQLAATAVSMIDGSAEQVRAALIDYRETRPILLTDEFIDYEVNDDGTVNWKLALYEALRNKRGKKPKRQKQPLWECRIEVDTDGNRIVERDIHSTLVTTWSLNESSDGRTAVRIDVTWDGPDGFTSVMSRQKDQLSMRTLYEGLLTNLHHYFEKPPPDPEIDPEFDPEADIEPESPTQNP